ncbi:MAG TPA: hypothetical protein VMS31_06475 [Pyrinomonadaceae bacterium]|nr:hypothetical protein [Pyrinomonadaceae bacterium]
MTESLHEELYLEPKSSFGLKIIAAVAAIIVTVSVFAGYTYLRQRHAATAPVPVAQNEAAQAQPSPKALILVDEALLQGNKTVVGGTVKNISPETLQQVTVALELKRRKDAATEKRLVTITPAGLEPGQEGRYSLELKASDYGSARLVGLSTGADLPIAYTSAAGRKRPLERLESKTIVVGRPPSKRDEFLNSPDNPARVP